MGCREQDSTAVLARANGHRSPGAKPSSARNPASGPPSSERAAARFKALTNSEIAFVVVIHIAQVGDAVAGPAVYAAERLELAAQHVTHGFRPVAVPARLDELVELDGEIGVERNRKSFHAAFLLHPETDGPPAGSQNEPGCA